MRQRNCGRRRRSAQSDNSSRQTLLNRADIRMQTAREEMLHRRELPKVLAPDEVEKLLDRPNRDAPTGLRNLCMIHLMLRCGLRAGEVCGLLENDIKWRTQTVHIRSEIAKYGREAHLPIDAETFALLKQWRRVRRPYAARTDAPWMFVTLPGGQVDRVYVWRMVERYARKAGIVEPCWPHRLRHTFATNLLRKGYNIREVQHLVRHADLRTTQIYLEINDEELFDRMRKQEW
jgi:integrase/recombinase XerD